MRFSLLGIAHRGTGNLCRGRLRNQEKYCKKSKETDSNRHSSERLTFGVQVLLSLPTKLRLLASSSLGESLATWISPACSGMNHGWRESGNDRCSLQRLDAPLVALRFAHEHCVCTRRAKVERSLSTRNPREIRGCKACKGADCLESKREGVSCHKSCNEMTHESGASNRFCERQAPNVPV